MWACLEALLFALLNSLHPDICVHVVWTVLYKFLLYLQENSSNNEELLEFAAISFIFMTLMRDLGMML